MLQGAPALFEFGGGASPQGADVSDQGVRCAGVGVQGLLGLALGTADGDPDTDARTDIALVRQSRHSLGGCLVRRG
jgi:hypothetical protein